MLASCMDLTVHRESIVAVIRYGKPHQSEKRKSVKDSNLPKRAITTKEDTPQHWETVIQ